MTLPVDVFPQVMRALDLISQGHTLSAACDLAQVDMGTFKRYLRDNAELQDVFNESEQRGYDRMADALLNMDLDPVYAQTDPKKMKIMSDNIKWYLSRKRPQQYGERVVVEHNITADRAIVDALERGKQRAIGRILEDVTVDVVDYSVRSAVAAIPARLNTDGVDEELLQFL